VKTISFGAVSLDSHNVVWLPACSLGPQLILEYWRSCRGLRVYWWRRGFAALFHWKFERRARRSVR